MSRRRAALYASLLALSVGSGQAATALSLTLAGPSTGPLAAGIGSEASAPGSQLSFSIGLDAVTGINGYDVTLAWDATELALFSSAAGPGLPFSVAPDAGQSAGSRVASITLIPASTALLFSVTFDVLATTADGLADVRVFVDAPSNGTGIAPGSLSLANPAGAGIDVIPEPASGAMLALGLAGLSAARARARRSRS
jgi:hypothetical protein